MSQRKGIVGQGQMLVELRMAERLREAKNERLSREIVRANRAGKGLSWLREMSKTLDLLKRVVSKERLVESDRAISADRESPSGDGNAPIRVSSRAGGK